jgi:polyphosphate kinase
MTREIPGMREISLEELSTDEHGYSIDDDVEDEPVLLDREGKPVET